MQRPLGAWRGYLPASPVDERQNARSEKLVLVREPWPLRQLACRRKRRDAMETRVIPAEEAFAAWDEDPAKRWQVSPLLEELKAKAKKLGLWNLFLPSQGLSNLDYARLAERMCLT